MTTTTDITNCTICIKPLDLEKNEGVIILECCHMFHSACLLEYAVSCGTQKSVLKCPLCRSIVISPCESAEMGQNDSRTLVDNNVAVINTKPHCKSCVCAIITILFIAMFFGFRTLMF